MRKRIDKSVLTFGEPERVRDEKYRQSAQGRNCMACELAGRTAPLGTVVLAHINIAGNFGRGLKAGDDESVFLCDKCHTEMDSGNAADWILRNLFLPERKRAYRKWKAA